MTRASLVIGVALLAACQQSDVSLGPSASSLPLAAATTHFSDKVVFTNDLLVQNPCTGEDILLHLDQLFMIREVSVEGKFFHGHLTFLDRGTKGEGLTSGAVYRQTGAEQNFLHVPLEGEVGVSVRVQFNLHLIGQGSAPNFLAHEILRVTISPEGVVKLAFDKVRAVCRG